MRFNFPSEQFPALTAVSVDVPEGWGPDTAGPAIMVFFDANSPDEFRTNVTITVERVDADTSPDVIAEKFAAQMSSEQQFTVHGEEHAEVGGRPALLRAQSFEPEGFAIPVFQTQCLVVVPTASQACSDLVVVHATCSGAHAERYGVVFREIFDSLQFG